MKWGQVEPRDKTKHFKAYWLIYVSFSFWISIWIFWSVVFLTWARFCFFLTRYYHNTFSVVVLSALNSISTLALLLFWFTVLAFFHFNLMNWFECAWHIDALKVDVENWIFDLYAHLRSHVPCARIYVYQIRDEHKMCNQVILLD